MLTTTRGRLVAWKADKAYGFIRPDQGGKDVFVHLRDFGRIGRDPRVGDVVSFQRMSDGTGKVRAADVSIHGVERQHSAHRRPVELAPRRGHLIVALVFFASIAALVAYRGLPLVIPIAYVVASLITFLLYAFDKAAAMNRRWRTEESTLLIAGLLGGWPGALVAQGMFRHKSSKTPFQVAFWLTVVANCVVIGWWCFG